MSIVASNAFVSSKTSAASLSLECVIWRSKLVVPYIISVFGSILGLPSPNRNKVYYFVQNKLNNPGFLSEAYFVAIHNSEYIGLSFLEARPGENYLFTGLTGVKRPFRGKRIAQILK